MDAIDASVGNDLVETGTGNDVVIGGLGFETITVADGNNIIFGDEGFIQYQAQAVTLPINTSVLREVSSMYLDLADTFVQGGNDTITVGASIGSTGAGSDIVIAGLGNDGITIGNGDNIVIADEGGITYQTGAGLRDLVTSRYLDGAGLSALDAAEAVVGNDTIETGSGSDVIIGGLGGITVPGAVTIAAGDGDNIVLADEGFIQYQAQNLTGNTSVLREVSSLYLDNTATGDLDLDTFVQGGDERITTGAHNDIVIGSLGNDDIVAGNGDNIVIADEGGITYQTGTGLRDLITSRYLNEAGFAPMDAIDASVGNDLVETGTGNDVVIGGLGFETITVADGNNIVIGDEGFIQYQAQAVTVPINTSVLDEVSSLYLDLAGTFVQGGNDTIKVGASPGSTGAGSDVVIGGLGNDGITIGDGDNIVFGDEGMIMYQVGSGLPGWIVSLYLDDVPGIPARSPHDAPEAEVGNDGIITGVDDDIVIGGLGRDIISVSDGDNIVLGDEGEVHYQVQSTNLERIVTQFTDGAGEFVQGGDDEITSGIGRDFILMGSGSDTVNSGDGSDVVLGDGEILFHPGTNVPASIVTAPQDDNLTLLPPSDSVIFAGGGEDIVLAGSGNDWVEGGTEDDILIGDEGVITFDQGRALENPAQTVPDFIQTVFFTADGQLIPGDTDVLLGQDDDDIVIGGSFDDILDGGSDRDMVFGNNVTLDRTGARLGVNTNPRFKTLTGEEIYATGINALGDLLINRSTDLSADYEDPNWEGSPPFWGDFVITVHDGMTTPAGDPLVGQDLDNRTFGNNRTYGNNFIAGGSHDDTIFGQRGEDTIQGDGTVFFDVWDAGRLFAQGEPTVGATGATINAAGLDSDPLELWAILSASRALSWQDGTPVDTPRSFEALDDGDDYIEGGINDDVIFGNLGQNDIIGGNSNQFGLTATFQRDPSGDNMIFGGAGTRTGHSDPGFNVDGDPLPDGQVFLSEDHSHARNASVILGDNGNIFRLTGTNGGNSGANLTFNYDSEDESRGDLRIKARGVDLLDYARWQMVLDHDPDPDAVLPEYLGYLGFERVIGGSDLIRGESGDDRIYGMGGDNAIFGDGQDDAIVGGYGDNWISGGTGHDGIISDDGVVLTSRNVEKAGNNDATLSEPLYGIAKLDEVNLLISTPGNLQQAVINIEGELRHTVQLYFFNHGGNDIVYGGLGNDFIHSGWGNDAVSGAEALPEYYSGELNWLLRVQQGVIANDAWYDSIAPVNPGDILQFDPTKGEFALYDEFDPWRKIMVNNLGEAGGDPVHEFFLNFDETEGPGVDDPTYGTVNTDGNDRIFGDSGNDWLVEGTGRGHVYGGMGDDLINIDDDLNSTAGTADPLANNVPDTHLSYEDITYGGAGRDILIGNTGGDRMLDWVGEFNSFIVPFAPFGAFAISRALAPQIGDYLNDLARSDGSDQWLPDWERFAVEFDADPTIDSPNPARNFEPYGELGMIRQQDPGWGEQTGAPDDPQPGNIAGGSRDVLRSANFNDGSMDGFQPDSGTFEVQGGALDVAAESLGGDAVSVYHVDQQLPGYFEISAFVKTDKPTGGWKANAYVIFDYQSETDFKFAGINVSTKKIQIGHRTAGGRPVDVQSNIQLKANKFYHVLTAINGTTVTVVVDNQDVFSHTFEARIEDGWAYGLNWGYVGVGSDNARGTFENVEVRVLPPEFTFEHTEDFDVGAGVLTGLQSGDWQVAGGRYEVTPGSEIALSLVDLGQRLGTASLLDLSTTLRTDAVGGFVFDVYGPEEFKFVALDAQSDQILVGHHTVRGGWTVDATASANLTAGVDYELSAFLKGTTVSASVTSPGEQVPFALLGHVFNSAVVDGDFGLMGRTGATSFDTMTFKTDDPAFDS